MRALRRGSTVMLAIAVLSYGCGSAGEPMLNRAQIGAFAARVNLRSRDINGAVNVGGGESRIEPPDAPQAQVLRCAGASAGKQPYRVSSPVIETGRGAKITSTVLALPGSASAATTAAREWLAAMRSARWPACQQRYDEHLQRVLAAALSQRVPSVRVLPSPLEKLPATAARRTRVELTRVRTIELPTETSVETRRSSTRVTTYEDLVAFVAGRALVELEASARGAPPSSALERRAVALLRARAGSRGP
jgi:hypothetical protein